VVKHQPQVKIHRQVMGIEVVGSIPTASSKDTQTPVPMCNHYHGLFSSLVISSLVISSLLLIYIYIYTPSSLLSQGVVSGDVKTAGAGITKMRKMHSRVDLHSRDVVETYNEQCIAFADKIGKFKLSVCLCCKLL